MRIECGAKSALDPHESVVLQPYIADDAPQIELAVSGVTTIEAKRTFWDKIVIVHGLRRWHERRGVLRQEGQRISRHYYDLQCLMRTDAGRAALADRDLGAECVRHARTFFDRPGYDLATAKPGSFAIAPNDPMLASLRRDYESMAPMIFGNAPEFEEVLDSMRKLDEAVNLDDASRRRGPGRA